MSAQFKIKMQTFCNSVHVFCRILGPVRLGDLRPARDRACHAPRESNNLYHNVVLLHLMAAPASHSRENRSWHAPTKSGSMLLPNEARQQTRRLDRQHHVRRLRRQWQTQARQDARRQHCRRQRQAQRLVEQTVLERFACDGFAVRDPTHYHLLSLCRQEGHLHAADCSDGR